MLFNHVCLFFLPANVQILCVTDKDTLSPALSRGESGRSQIKSSSFSFHPELYRS